MTTYAEVFLKNELIRNFAKQFGYTDEVKIYYELPEKADAKIELRFVVKKPDGESISFNNRSWLGAKLSAELCCEVSITVYDNVDNLYRYDTDRKSALITDENAIKEVIYRINNNISKLTKLKDSDLKNIENIKFNEIICKKIVNEDDKSLQETLLEQADEYLKKNSEQEQKSPTVETTDPYSIVGKSPSQQKRKSLAKEENNQETDDHKKVKSNGDNGNKSKIIIGRSP